MSHECPADDCGETVSREVMCRKHWRMVPRPAQREVTAAWRAYSRARQTVPVAMGNGHGRPEAYRDYLVARKAAVDFVNGRLSKA
jgi:hypothetical protein